MSAGARAACTCLSIMPDDIEEAFTSLGVGPDDIDLIIATDAEQILGIGEWGVGGIEVPIGKLAIYTAAGGIDPARGIAVMLDVGTNRESLLDDPTYIGNQHARIRGERYDAFIDAYVKAVTKLFPKAMLQLEDFAPGNGRRILEKYRDQVSALSMMICRAPAPSHWRRPFPPCAFAGRLCAISAWLFLEPVPRASESRTRFATPWCAKGFRKKMHRDVSGAWTSSGLLTTDLADQLHDYQAAYARPAAESKSWKHDLPGNGLSLAEVVQARFAHHADRRVDRLRQLHRIDRKGNGGAYGAADHLRAVESSGAVGGESCRSDCLDGRTRADRHRQPVRAGHL